MSTLVNGSGHAPIGPLVELHEHQVPDLEPARAVLGVVGDALRALGELRAAIEMDLAARPARTRLGHPPEVLVVAGVDVAPDAPSARGAGPISSRQTARATSSSL